MNCASLLWADMDVHKQSMCNEGMNKYDIATKTYTLRIIKTCRVKPPYSEIQRTQIFVLVYIRVLCAEVLVYIYDCV